MLTAVFVSPVMHLQVSSLPAWKSKAFGFFLFFFYSLIQQPEKEKKKNSKCKTQQLDHIFPMNVKECQSCGLSKFSSDPATHKYTVGLYQPD